MSRGRETRLTVMRVLLSPRTSWHAYTAKRRSKSPLTFAAAWRCARLRGHPDEASYWIQEDPAGAFRHPEGPSRGAPYGRGT